MLSCPCPARAITLPLRQVTPPQHHSLPCQAWVVNTGLTAGLAWEYAISPWTGVEGGRLMLQLDPGPTVMLCPIVGAAPWWLGAGGDSGG